MDYLGPDELTFLAKPDREELDRILGRLFNLAIERVLCSIPDMLVHLSKRTELVNELYKGLFEKIPEALEDRANLASVIQGLELKNPGMSPQDLFALVPAAYKEHKGLINMVGVVDMSRLNESVNGVL